MNRADKDQPDSICAGQLCAEHVGELIRFREFDQDREINRIVTAELRQIHHNGGGTHLTYGNLAEREVMMPHSQPVILRPAEDYSDVVRLLGDDDFAVQYRGRVVL